MTEPEPKKRGKLRQSGGETPPVSPPAAPLPPPSTMPPTFVFLLSQLASQVFVAIGYFENPITGRKEVNLEAAKFTIDLLEMLQKKTANNLSDEEARYLAHILHETRLKYADAAKR